MTPENFSENVKTCISELQKEIPFLIWDGTDMSIATGAMGKSFGNNIVGLVKRRITTQGEGINGKFPDYTPKYKAFKSGETRIQSSKKILKSGKLSKGKFHKSRYQGFRDLTYTGDLMLAFQPYKNGNKYGIGFKEDEAKKIAIGNSFGNGKWAGVGVNVIEPTESEIKMCTESFEAEILNILKKYLT
jgi:hypothetical protein